MSESRFVALFGEEGQQRLVFDNYTKFLWEMNVCAHVMGLDPVVWTACAGKWSCPLQSASVV